jgi:UDP-galactopyranose mutase
MKQWGFKPEHLGEDVMNRVPVRISRDDRACSDKYQFMPKDGFTEMVANMLCHPKIKLKLGTDAKKHIKLCDGVIYLNGKEFDGTLIYTGCVDELFGYKYGTLPHRSLTFKFKTKNTSSYQESAVVNYTTSHKFTRISEFTKFACAPKEKTVIVSEYSKPFKRGRNIPYYPIPLDKNYTHYGKYAEESKKYKGLYLLGRLANYKYVNMDIAVKNAIELFHKIKEEI